MGKMDQCAECYAKNQNRAPRACTPINQHRQLQQQQCAAPVTACYCGCGIPDRALPCRKPQNYRVCTQNPTEPQQHLCLAGAITHAKTLCMCTPRSDPEFPPQICEISLQTSAACSSVRIKSRCSSNVTIAAVSERSGKSCKISSLQGSIRSTSEDDTTISSDFSESHSDSWETTSTSKSAGSKKVQLPEMIETQVEEESRTEIVPQNSDEDQTNPPADGQMEIQSEEQIQVFTEDDEFQTESQEYQEQDVLSNHEMAPAATDQNEEQGDDCEYVRLLLKITEDILINDYYTDSDMEIVFAKHVEANKEHLDTKKMLERIEELKRDLNFPLLSRLRQKRRMDSQRSSQQENVVNKEEDQEQSGEDLKQQIISELKRQFQEQYQQQLQQQREAEAHYENCVNGNYSEKCVILLQKCLRHARKLAQREGYLMSIEQLRVILERRWCDLQNKLAFRPPRCYC